MPCPAITRCGWRKRCGQFWRTAGDEALLALEICWRNDRWEPRFPHVVLTSATPN